MNHDDTQFEPELDGEDIEIEAIGIEVSSHPIELYKVFKIANLVDGGGEAKYLISEGYVAVNGELETRKRRKMYDGDFFEFNQEYYVVVCDQPVSEPQERKQDSSPSETAKPSKNKASKGKSKSKQSSAAKKSNKPAKKSKDDSKSAPQRDKNSGRNSIDFF
ncbi:RNA-binding S4 domain-containing protein [Vibrio mexicanus]|uniref:RNA-binding S4 domain-containing protein n=1 Tax=Vibrio mexicanus TaxID=1004326 RepID=UPI000A482795|nr:RNA-binding S4 domain-containing protein [Vibrio mexicanus]